VTTEQLVALAAWLCAITMATQKARFANALDAAGTKDPTRDYDCADLHRMCTAMLAAAGATHEDADYVAGTLISASLAGVDSHGIIRMERYIGGIEEGSVRPRQKHEVTVDKVSRIPFAVRVVVGCGLRGEISLSLAGCGSWPACLVMDLDVH
jgi:hypothetical protein